MNNILNVSIGEYTDSLLRDIEDNIKEINKKRENYDLIFANQISGLILTKQIILDAKERLERGYSDED